MCIYCDLKKLNKDGIKARDHIDRIIDRLERLTAEYIKLRRGMIKPHCKDMEMMLLIEKALLREFVNNL